MRYAGRRGRRGREGGTVGDCGWRKLRKGKSVFLPLLLCQSRFLHLTSPSLPPLLPTDTQADNLAARAFFEKSGFDGLEDHVYYSKEMQAEGEGEEGEGAIEGGVEEGGGVQKKAKGMPQPRLTRLTKTKKVGEKKVGETKKSSKKG